MNFETDLPLSIDRLGNRYIATLVIVDYLIKIMHYKPVKTIIDATGLVKVIIYIVEKYYDQLESITND